MIESPQASRSQESSQTELTNFQSLTARSPLFPVALGLVAGIPIDDRIGLTRATCLWVFGASLAFFLWPWFRSHCGVICVLLCAASVGGLRHADAVRIRPSHDIGHMVDEVTNPRRLVRVEGTVVSEPCLIEQNRNEPFAPWTYGGDRTVFLMDVSALVGESETTSATGRLRVTVDEAVLDLQLGETVSILGWLRPLRSPRNPGVYDWATHYRRRGISASLTCNMSENVRRLPQTATQVGFVQRLRDLSLRLLVEAPPDAEPAQSDLLEAMLLGRRSSVTGTLNEAFIRAGCAHFLAVSGVHVVIVMVLARLMVGAFLRSPRARLVAVMIAVLAYTLLAEPRPPILRACLMAQLYCLARLMGRGRNYLNWLSAAAAVLLIHNPATLFDVGFQLSFSAVLGVAYLSPALFRAAKHLGVRWGLVDAVGSAKARHAPPPQRNTAQRITRNAARYVVQGLSVSLAAWLAGAPLIAIHFERLQPWGPVNSLIVYPLVGIVMGLGFFKVLLALITPTVAAWVGAGLLSCESWLRDVVASLSKLPFASVRVSGPGVLWSIAFYGLLALIAWRFRAPSKSLLADPDEAAETKPSHMNAFAPHAAVVLTLILIVGGIVRHRPADRPAQVTVTVLAVGAGLATVIELPNGETLLYDAGTSSPYNVGRSTIVPFLRYRGISQVDAIYISHPNLDHFSGVPAIVDSVPTGPVSVNHRFDGLSGLRSPARRLLELLADRDHPIEVRGIAGQTWHHNDVQIDCVWPPGGQSDELSGNDASTVLRVSYAGRSILLTGDIEERPLRALAARDDVHADVLLLPHHGAVTPSLSLFLDRVSPNVLIRSSHVRTADTVTDLGEVARNLPTYNTADLGAVRIVIDASGVHVSAPVAEHRIAVHSSGK